MAKEKAYVAIEGFNDFRRNLHKVAPEVDSQFRKKMVVIIRPIREEASRRAPYKTGALKKSVKYSITQKGASLYSKVPYANAQEWGTSGKPNSKVQPRGIPIKIRGTHFAYSAVLDAKPRVENGLREAFVTAAHDHGFKT